MLNSALCEMWLQDKPGAAKQLLLRVIRNVNHSALPYRFINKLSVLDYKINHFLWIFDEIYTTFAYQIRYDLWPSVRLYVCMCETTRGRLKRFSWNAAPVLGSWIKTWQQLTPYTWPASVRICTHLSCIYRSAECLEQNLQRKIKHFSHLVHFFVNLVVVEVIKQMDLKRQN